MICCSHNRNLILILTELRQSQAPHQDLQMPLRSGRIFSTVPRAYHSLATGAALWSSVGRPHPRSGPCFSLCLECFVLAPYHGAQAITFSRWPSWSIQAKQLKSQPSPPLVPLSTSLLCFLHSTYCYSKCYSLYLICIPPGISVA